MAVYTPVDLPAAQALAARLCLGEVLTLEPIGSGIENTNYFLGTREGAWVLTLFERLPDDQQRYCLRLMQHLARRGLPVPAPRENAQGEIVQRVAGKPAAVVERLPGHHRHAPDLHHCAQLGAVLARMHVAAADFALAQRNPRDLAWCGETAPQVQPFLDAGQRALLAGELAFQHTLGSSPARAALPRGAIHADLFCDNVLFDGLPGHERLSGCLDFYFAGDDAYALDLAVCLNDWCLGGDDGRLDDARAQALVAAYERVRPLAPAEVRLLPALLRAAALRFWLSRLADLHLPRDAQLLAAKDPAHFERVLRARVAEPWHPPR